MEPHIEDREAMARDLNSLREIAETSGRAWGAYEDYLFKAAWLAGASHMGHSVQNIIPIPLSENSGKE